MDIATSRRFTWAALAIIAAIAMFRIAYVAFWCPLDLAPDEAYYWDWSRRLDWSYHSKGPLVAWLIRTSCSLLGDTVLGVRLPAIVSGCLMLLGLFTLARESCRDERRAFLLILLALTLPIVSAGGILMTIDAPFTCAWTWALVFGRRAVFEQQDWSWPMAGGCILLGILAKVTMVLWLPSFVFFLLATPKHREHLGRRGFWIMLMIGALGTIPILVWNATHDWVTLKHTQSHAGLEEESSIHWLGPMRYLGVQFAVLLGSWFAAWLWTMWRHRPSANSDAEGNYLWWMSAPTFVFFGLFAFKNGGGEANWPIAAYLSGAVLTLRAWPVGLEASNLRLVGVFSTAAVGLLLTIGIHAPLVMQPVLLRIAGPETSERPMPMRRVDPTCRMRGWRQLAGEVDAVRAELMARGVTPILAAERWTQAGELAFYCDNQPSVYCLGVLLDDRDSQYDLWRPNPCANQDEFKGQTFVAIGVDLDRLAHRFESFEIVRKVTHRSDGQPLAEWSIAIGHRFTPVRPGSTPVQAQDSRQGAKEHATAGNRRRGVRSFNECYIGDELELLVCLQYDHVALARRAVDVHARDDWRRVKRALDAFPPVGFAGFRIGARDDAAIAPQKQEVVLGNWRRHERGIAVDLECRFEICLAIRTQSKGFITHVEPGSGRENRVAEQNGRSNRAFDMALVENVRVPVALARPWIEAGDAVLIADGDQLRCLPLALIQDRRCIRVAALAGDTPAILTRVGVDGDDAVLAVLLAGQHHHAFMNNG